jgi:hypothetical protein
MSLQEACNVSRASTICRGTTFPYPGFSRERLVSPAFTWSAPRVQLGTLPICSVAGSRLGLTRHARTVLAKPDREAVRTDPARPAPAAELLDTTPSTAARHRLRASPPRHSSPHPCRAWPAARTHATRLAGTRRPSPAVQCTTRQRGAGSRVRAGWFVLHHDSASATNGRLDEPRRRDSSLIDRPTVSR